MRVTEQPGGSVPPFERLVEQHGLAVLRMCRAHVGVQEADDVWQETFLAALRAYGQGPAIRDDEAWLIRIARNKVIDHVRAAGRRPEPMVGEDDDVAATVPDVADPDGAVWADVAQLPTKQRQCVGYRYLGGLSYEHIAEILGGTAAAARRATADGIAALRHHRDRRPA
ncbi:sigma-70 family RNA polymerase sigma factor [Zhihengliuella somnathii]